MTRVAAALLERVFGAERAASILGDLEEEISLGRPSRWASRAPGAWLLWQALVHIVAVRWSGDPAELPHTGRPPRLEITTHVVRRP